MGIGVLTLTSAPNETWRMNLWMQGSKGAGHRSHHNPNLCFEAALCLILSMKLRLPLNLQSPYFYLLSARITAVYHRGWPAASHSYSAPHSTILLTLHLEHKKAVDFPWTACVEVGQLRRWGTRLRHVP
jgi:hypothetical protein